MRQHLTISCSLLDLTFNTRMLAWILITWTSSSSTQTLRYMNDYFWSMKGERYIGTSKRGELLLSHRIPVWSSFIPLHLDSLMLCMLLERSGLWRKMISFHMQTNHTTIGQVIVMWQTIILVCRVHTLYNCTGYFTSRPALKGYVRDMNNLLQVCMQIEALGLGSGKQMSSHTSMLLSMLFDLRDCSRLLGQTWLGPAEHDNGVLFDC